MGEIRWSNSSLDDLDAIGAYISRDSEHQAELFVLRVEKAVRRLADFPMSGRQTPEYANPLKREIIVGFYRVMYDVLEDGVLIKAVIHGARDFKP